MRFILLVIPLALATTPALAAPHSGVPRIRTGPELSDIALFLMAAFGIWVIRRTLRARFSGPSKADPLQADPPED